MLWLMCLPGGLTARDSLRVMTFNIRFDNPGDGVNRWEARRPLVKDLISRLRPDLIGTQEGLQHQVTAIADDHPEFSWYGIGRDDGAAKGEYAAVYIRQSRFDVIGKGNFWLSETPESPGSIGWDAACPRLVTWVKLHDKQADKILFFFNTHFDHIGKTARRESVGMLLSKIKEIAPDMPQIVCGDFNLTPDTDLYKRLTAQDSAGAAVLFDTRTVSQHNPEGPAWSFHGFGKAADRPLLDYIFVNDRFNVTRHLTVDSQQSGLYPSDHLPVIADLEWPGKNIK
jgi:endonuclease/exonuclease/phosphatase family metal-dependent hydrolase